MDPGLNQLLKWSVENSTDASADPTSTSDPKATRASGQPLNANAINALMGGPSDADLMRAAVAVVTAADTPLDDKVIAFDNLEQLLENIDNANDLKALELWEPLLGLLGNEEKEMRKMAAWCVGTAVQNNDKAQKEASERGAVERLVEMAVADEEREVRRKAVYALSSAVRNHQPAVESMVRLLPRDVLQGIQNGKKVQAGDMEALDTIMERLRERASGDQS
ncbi:MAG: hsp70 nucleotide exchange factor fes1 [Piccolia ochrophora]|nr:MAG: hsp70 nucleotide exchange factor fes1 [Piccolia ochrophora]